MSYDLNVDILIINLVLVIFVTNIVEKRQKLEHPFFVEVLEIVYDTEPQWKLFEV